MQPYAVVHYHNGIGHVHRFPTYSRADLLEQIAGVRREGYMILSVALSPHLHGVALAPRVHSADQSLDYPPRGVWRGARGRAAVAEATAGV